MLIINNEQKSGVQGPAWSLADEMNLNLPPVPTSKEVEIWAW